MKKIAILLAALAGASAQADTLLIEGIAAASTSAQQRPARGMSMESVESRYGAPSARVAAVGTPPISRWEYPGFVVYFEHQHVIHSAVRR